MSECNEKKEQSTINPEKMIELAHQGMIANENKSLVILTVYMALVSFIGRELVNASTKMTPIYLGVLGFVIGIPLIIILFGYRKWKSHYLKTIHRLLDANNFPQRDRPTSFRTDIKELERIYWTSIDQFIGIILILLCIGSLAGSIYQIFSLPWSK